MRFDTLAQWLDYQQTLNPQTIELGLERVARVYQRLGAPVLAKKVITVAGTNGKGSTVAAYEHWLSRRGFRVASYTSPHLQRYNERIRLGQCEVDDASLVAVFDEIERKRGDDQLTYFEFGTLAAFLLIARYQPDFAILEVGLGGRLDAVNIVDADLAHITMIGLDHQDWLGATRELIALEKAGILREGKLALCNDADPPASLLQRLQESGARHWLLGRDYKYQLSDDGRLEWHGGAFRFEMRMPLAQRFQAQNLAGVLAGLCQLGCLDGVESDEIERCFNGMQVRGRFQMIDSILEASLFIDVGHNPDAARVVAKELDQLDTKGRRVMLLGMLADKDCNAFVTELTAVVDEWWFIDLDCERGQSAAQLLGRLQQKPARYRTYSSAREALQQAMSCLGNQDILVAAGSFMTVEAVLENSEFMQTH